MPSVFIAVKISSSVKHRWAALQNPDHYKSARLEKAAAPVKKNGPWVGNISARSSSNTGVGEASVGRAIIARPNGE
jgi:hypothetical protein